MKKTILTIILALVATTNWAQTNTVPSDWFKTDTITIRGRIENFDAEKFGFTSMQCILTDVLEYEGNTILLNIAADGTFEKKFQANYPVFNEFFNYDSKNGFSEMYFFARPGETIDITVKTNAEGQYECFYNSGSSKDLERWLKSGLTVENLKRSRTLADFNGKFSEADKEAERTWQDMLSHLQEESSRLHFTPQEMHIALADLQVTFAYAMLDYSWNHERGIRNLEERDGVSHQEITDSAEWKEFDKPENYKPLHRVDFNNPQLLSTAFFPVVLNRLQFFTTNNLPKSKILGTDNNNLMVQLYNYKKMMSNFKEWRAHEEDIPQKMQDYLNTVTNPFIRQKAEAFYAQQMAQTDISTPLPANNVSADLIRSLSKKFPGRYLLIDFWGMSCGPCRSAIQKSKNLRKEIAKRDDIKLIFIAGERTAEGSEAYQKYVKEWLADETTICLVNAEFTRLMELFNFSAIPHYETITPDGQRVSESFQIHGYDNLESELELLKDKTLNNRQE